MSHPDYNVIGYLSRSMGLSVAARNTIAVLEAGDRRVREIDVNPEHRAPERDGLGRSAGAVNLFHTNPLEILEFSPDWTPHVTVSDPRACVPFWEMPHLPLRWVPVLETMDAVLAPSEFIAEACRASLSRPVVHYPQAVFPPHVAPDRARFGMREGVVTFLSAFDPGGDMERKNPWGAIRAFEQAFGGSHEAELLIHLHLWNPDAEQARRAEELEREVAGNPAIRVLREPLTYEDVLSLYASCDVFVSLHRAEGLGLPLMEAMSLGRTALATGWSGNLDFMDAANSCLVGYSLGRIGAVRHPMYLPEARREEQVWAEPDLGDAARWMRRLAGDADLRRTLGRRAAEDMEERRRLVLQGATFDRLESVARSEAGSRPARDRALRGLLRSAIRPRVVGKLKRRTVLTLRALRLYPPGD